MTAVRDGNRITGFQAVLNTDGSTPVNIKANTSNSNSIQADDNVTGSDNGPTDAKRDGNYVAVAMAVSEADGTTPIALYSNSDGHLLIDSN